MGSQYSHFQYFTLVDFKIRTAVLSTCVATMSSLAQLWVWDTAKQRQHRRDNARLTKSGNARSEQMPEVSSYLWCLQSHTNRLRMATRGALEWVGMFKGPTGFGYELSDLFCMQQIQGLIVVSLLWPVTSAHVLYCISINLPYGTEYCCRTNLHSWAPINHRHQAPESRQLHYPILMDKEVFCPDTPTRKRNTYS